MAELNAVTKPLFEKAVAQVASAELPSEPLAGADAIERHGGSGLSCAVDAVRATRWQGSRRCALVY
jgi:hypothetical protein